MFVLKIIKIIVILYDVMILPKKELPVRKKIFSDDIFVDFKTFYILKMTKKIVINFSPFNSLLIEIFWPSFIQTGRTLTVLYE